MSRDEDTADPAFSSELVARSYRVLDEARYLALATVSPDGMPWSAVLQYTWLDFPLRFVVGSAIGSRHCRDISAHPFVAGSLFVGGAGPLDPSMIDGAQFNGRCRELRGVELDDHYEQFYRSIFPDAQERAEWILPRSLLKPPAEHRLFVIEVDSWWLVDTRTWAQDRVDRRVEVPLETLARP